MTRLDAIEFLLVELTLTVQKLDISPMQRQILDGKLADLHRAGMEEEKPGIELFRMRADIISAQSFNDGNKFSAMLSSGRIVRCETQDGVETVAMQGNADVQFAHKDNFIEVVSGGNVIGLIWTQS